MTTVGSKRSVQILTTDFPPLTGGIAVFATNIARALNTANVDAWVVTSAPGDSEVDASVEVHRKPAGGVRATLALISVARHIARRRRPDVNLAMTWKHDGIAAYLLRRSSGVPYIIVVHGSEILRFRDRSILSRVMKRVLGNASVIVANSNYTKSLVVAAGIPDAKVVVVHPFIELPTPLTATDSFTGLPLDGKLVLFTAARLVPRKGHARVIDALARLKDEHPDVVYVMTGRGDHRQVLEDRVRSLGVADRVFMTAEVSDDVLRALFDRADIYVSAAEEDPEDVEGFGIALIEAAAHRKPVVAGRCGGSVEAVRDEETGFLVGLEDPEELETRLRHLIQDAGLRLRLGDAGRRWVEAEFGLEAGGARLAAIVARAAGARDPGVDQAG